MLSRRHFLASGAALPLGTGAFTASQLAAAPRLGKSFFGVNSFVESNPNAVFIMRTRVKHKFDNEAKLNAGLQFAREVFVPQDGAPGIPVSHRVILKPNCTNVRSRNRPDEENWGTGTDPQFYEGIILGLKELGLKKFHFLEANNFHAWNFRGMMDVNDRHGVICNEPDRRDRNFLESYEMNWTKVPEPVVYTNIPHYAPLNEPDTWLLNIAKWKSHGMCMTLSTKNEQGLVVKPYVRFCPAWRMVTGVPDHMKPNIHPNVERVVNKFYEGHISKGYPRYQSKAELAPINQEIWAHKTLDHIQTTKPGLAIIEGIYGRDGNGFGIGNDYMTNLIMFSKNKLRLDMVGMWLGGHEPGNVNLFRIAKERGLSDTVNPHEVPVYEWEGGKASRRQLTDFERTPLKTYYLQMDGEPEYHLVNDPIDYDKVRI